MISIGVDYSKALARIEEIKNKQIKFATANTLSELAFKVAREEMPKVVSATFEGGATPYTRRGFKFKRAKKTNLNALVFISASTHEYLTTQVTGGTRTPKNKKIFVPTDRVKKNKYGNVTKGKRQKMFSSGGKHFQGTPKGRSGPAFLGVWERYGKNNKIRKVANFSNSADYKPLLDFRGAVKRYVRKNAAIIFRKKLAHALRTAKI
jgi:hypothetical protein